MNTDGESHARLPVLLFGFSLNHRSTNAIGPRVRSARSELVVIGMRIFQPLCTQAVLNQIHWGTKYFSELSAAHHWSDGTLVSSHRAHRSMSFAVDERAEVNPVTVAGGAGP